MKILFAIPLKVHKEIAEAEVEAFKKLGDDVEVSIYGNSDRVKGLIPRFLLILRNAVNLKIKLIQHKSDIVYLNTAFDRKTLVRDAISIFILKFFNPKVKIVLKTHGTIKQVVYSKSFVEKYVYNNSSLIFVLSSEEMKTFKTTFAGTTKIRATANAINFTEYIPDANFRSKLKVKDSTVVLLFVGRFLEQKGILDLIQACKIAKEKQLCFKLICLGSGPLFDQATELKNALDLTNEIEFLGHIEETDTRYYYANCDITILPSYREGFPMAVFQSVAAGKAIITTKINACADYFHEYENCLWTEIKNPTDLASKILTLSNDKELRDRMKVNNLLLAKRFTSVNIAENLKHEFKNLLESN